MGHGSEIKRTCWVPNSFFSCTRFTFAGILIAGLEARQECGLGVGQAPEGCLFCFLGLSCSNGVTEGGRTKESQRESPRAAWLMGEAFGFFCLDSSIKWLCDVGHLTLPL